MKYENTQLNRAKKFILTHCNSLTAVEGFIFKLQSLNDEWTQLKRDLYNFCCTYYNILSSPLPNDRVCFPEEFKLLSYSEVS